MRDASRTSSSFPVPYSKLAVLERARRTNLTLTVSDARDRHLTRLGGSSNPDCPCTRTRLEGACLKQVKSIARRARRKQARPAFRKRCFLALTSCSTTSLPPNDSLLERVAQHRSLHTDSARRSMSEAGQIDRAPRAAEASSDRMYHGTCCFRRPVQLFGRDAFSRSRVAVRRACLRTTACDCPCTRTRLEGACLKQVKSIARRARRKQARTGCARLRHMQGGISCLTVSLQYSNGRDGQI
jgi:hypothetical protein